MPFETSCIAGTLSFRSYNKDFVRTESHPCKIIDVVIGFALAIDHILSDIIKVEFSSFELY